jgi:hypothetical protein
MKYSNKNKLLYESFEFIYIFCKYGSKITFNKRKVMKIIGFKFDQNRRFRRSANEFISDYQ